MRVRGLHGPAHRAGQILEPRDLVRPFHVGARHRRQIRPKNGLGEVHRLVVLAGGEEHGGAGHAGVVEHAHGIAEPGRGVHVHRGELAAGVRVAVGHRDRDRLLERQDVADAGLAGEPVHQRQLGGARVAEHAVHAFLLEDL
jgi:hypothetical protein